MIELLNIVKEYRFGNETSRILRNISLKIEDKEFIGILGASGSGKSTLMHIIGLLDKPTSGKVYLDGTDTSLLSDDQISRLRSGHVGFVFQQFNLIEKLTVLENVMLPAIYSRKKIKFDPRGKALEILRLFGIEDRKDYYPNKISGGQQQRTAIARALFMNPKIILADEPTGNLDTKTGDEILKILQNLNREFNVTVVIVTHEKDVALKTKRQIFIRDGEIVSKYL